MKNRNAVLIVVALIIIVGGFIIFAQDDPATDTTQLDVDGATSTPDEIGTSTSNGTSSTQTSDNMSSGITMSDVNKHNSDASCWVAVGGNVYDLTSWIGQHPGGEEAIRGLCGTDGTDEFTGQHGSNAQAQQTLASFKIGELSQ